MGGGGLGNLNLVAFFTRCLCFQRVLRPPVYPGPAAGAGEQCVGVADGGQPVQSARHLLLVFSHGDVHQGPWLTDRGAAGQ